MISVRVCSGVFVCLSLLVSLCCRWVRHVTWPRRCWRPVWIWRTSSPLNRLTFTPWPSCFGKWRRDVRLLEVSGRTHTTNTCILTTCISWLSWISAFTYYTKNVKVLWEFRRCDHICWVKNIHTINWKTNFGYVENCVNQMYSIAWPFDFLLS